VTGDGPELIAGWKLVIWKVSFSLKSFRAVANYYLFYNALPNMYPGDRVVAALRQHCPVRSIDSK
jgi:hypothetical protein